MIRNLPPEEEFSKENYISEIDTAKNLLHKEVDVNLQQQLILKKKIAQTKDFLAASNSSDPKYGLYKTQMEMNQIELDELKNQEDHLREKIEKINLRGEK